MAIITKATADKWIEEGRAAHEGHTHHDGQRWAIIVDYQEQTINHYPVEFCEQPTNAMA